MGYKDFFSGKRVTLMGLGLLGRGVGDAEFLAPLCKELIVTDRKTAQELETSLQRLQKFSNIRYALGNHSEEDFTNTDMVIKGADVPLDSPFIAAARAAGVPVYMSTALFAQFAKEQGASLVGITGTRGKSTVTHLIYHSLIAAGRTAKLGGNVRGLSTLAMLPDVQKGEVVVLELDSWQLQGFGDLKISPDISVFTNLMEDHLNYYKGDTESYFWDKANIFLNQKPGNHLIVGNGIVGKIREAMPPVAPLVPPPIPHEWNLVLIGAHNKENAALAALALRMLGLTENEVRAGLESFMPVEGRLQKIAELNGVAVYNDNNATTPDATIAALNSFDSKVILIAGGSDKGLDLDGLRAAIINRCKKVLLLEGGGTDKLKERLSDVAVYSSIADAVQDAAASASAGDTILFSPAFASFGMFKNEYDRNDQFVAAVQALK